MKYKIDSELRNIAKFKMPASTKVLPAGYKFCAKMFEM